MTTATWPAGIPACPADWSEQDRDQVIRTAVDVGPGKTRRRATRQTTRAQARFVMSRDQWVTLRNWFRFDAAGGATAFAWPHPITGEALAWRFTQPPTASVIEQSGYLNVSAELEEI